MPGDFNVTRTATTPVSAPPTSGARGPAQAGEMVTRTKNISGPTTFNSDSGLVEPIEGGWTGATETPAPKPEGEKPAPSRQEAWRTLEAAKKAEREANKAKGAEKKQALARDFLKKGDLVGAAKSLGMTPSEFREYAQNVLLTVPTPDAELTPEQKKEADEKKFRDERLAFEKEQSEFRNNVVKSTYIKDKISPVLADKEKFEFCAQETGIDAYIYDFMNAHFTKTGEELSVSDVAETVEAELEKAAVAKVERMRGIKKAARLFAPKVDTEAESEVRETEVEVPVDRFAEPTLANMREVPTSSRFPAHEEETNPEPPRRVAAKLAPTAPGPRVPFALMTREERMRVMEEERRASR